MPTDSEKDRGDSLSEQLDWSTREPEEHQDELSEELDWSASKPEEKDDNSMGGSEKVDADDMKETDDITPVEGDVSALPSFLSRLSPKAWHMVQVAGGWIFGFLVWFCLAIGAMHPTNELLNWLFLVVFLIAMLLRNYFEQRLGVSMRTFMKWLLVSLVVFLGVFVILGPWLHVLPIDM